MLAEFHQTCDLTQILQNTGILRKQSKGLYLYGKSGCGKTTLATITYNKLKDISNGRLLFIHTPEMLLEFRESFRKESDITTRTESEILDKYSKNIEYLFLDDFGSEKISDYSLETVYLLLCRFENNTQASLFITSNLSLEQIATSMSDRIASRIAGLCDVIKIDDIDYRTSDKSGFVINYKNKLAIEYCQKMIDIEKDYQKRIMEREQEMKQKPICIETEQERQEVLEQIKETKERIFK